MTTRRKKKAWSESVGPYGHRIRVYEDPNSGIMYAEMRSLKELGKYCCISLRHRDKKEAVRWARTEVLKWQTEGPIAREAKPTVSRVLGLYLQHRTPQKSKSERDADERRAKMWTRML